MSVTTAPARPTTPLVELERTVTGAPDEEEGPVTGVRLVYRGQELQDVTVLTTEEEVPYRTDFRLPWPMWLHSAVAEARPLTPQEERRRVADVLARTYDGRPLDDLREEHAAHHLQAADAVLAVREDARPAVHARPCDCGGCATCMS